MADTKSLQEWLGARARELRAQAEELSEQASLLELAAAELARKPRYDTVPLAAVAEALALDSDAPLTNGAAHPPPGPPAHRRVAEREPEALKVGRPPTIDHHQTIRSALLVHGQLGPRKLSELTRISYPTLRIALLGMIAAGMLERIGGVRGPNVFYRLKGPNGAAANPGNSRQISAESATPTAAPNPAQSRPAAPAPQQAPAVQVPADPREKPKPPPGGHAPNPAQAAAPKNQTAERIARYREIAIEALREAGDRGMRPGQLRDELGLSPSDFDQVVNQLLDQNRISRIPRDEGGKVLRLKGAF